MKQQPTYEERQARQREYQRTYRKRKKEAGGREIKFPLTERGALALHYLRGLESQGTFFDLLLEEAAKAKWGPDWFERFNRGKD